MTAVALVTAENAINTIAMKNHQATKAVVSVLVAAATRPSATL